MQPANFLINQKIISTLDSLGFPIFCNTLYQNNELEQLEGLFSLLEMMLLDPSLTPAIKQKIQLALAISNNGIVDPQTLNQIR